MKSGALIEAQTSLISSAISVVQDPVQHARLPSHSKLGASMVITASEARSQLFPLIEQVNNDSAHVVITSKKGNAVLVSESEWESMVETMYLLRTRGNRERLVRSIDEIKAGELYVYELPITTTSEGRRVPRGVAKSAPAKKSRSTKSKATPHKVVKGVQKKTSVK